MCKLSGCVGDYTGQKELQAIIEESLYRAEAPRATLPLKAYSSQKASLLFPPQHKAACWMSKTQIEKQAWIYTLIVVLFLKKKPKWLHDYLL